MVTHQPNLVILPPQSLLKPHHLPFHLPPLWPCPPFPLTRTDHTHEAHTHIPILQVRRLRSGSEVRRAGIWPTFCQPAKPCSDQYWLLLEEKPAYPSTSDMTLSPGASCHAQSVLCSCLVKGTNEHKERRAGWQWGYAPASEGVGGDTCQQLDPCAELGGQESSLSRHAQQWNPRCARAPEEADFSPFFPTFPRFY